jgi:hypothetical protein
MARTTKSSKQDRNADENYLRTVKKPPHVAPQPSSDECLLGVSERHGIDLSYKTGSRPWELSTGLLFNNNFEAYKTCKSNGITSEPTKDLRVELNR